MAGYIGSKAVSVNTTSATISDDLTVGDDATIAGTALVTGVLTTTAATVFNGGFAANAGSTIATTDNSVNLTLTSTDADASGGPKMNFYRNSSSPAAGDVLTQIEHQGENDAGETVSYMYQNLRAAAVGDGAESGQFDINVYSAGTALERLGIDPTETVFNQDSADIDFRVESNGNANMLFVDGGDDRVAIGHNAPVAKLDVMGQGTSSSNLSMLIGADEGGTVNPGRTNNTDKACRIGVPHRSNSEEPFAMIVCSSTDGVNNVTIGGGTGAMNAATEIKFNTGGDATTTNGTRRMTIASTGNLQCLGVYADSGSDSPNVVVDSSGNIYRSTSALKYKQDIRNLESIDISSFRPVRYKNNSERGDNTVDHFGFIADEFHDAGLTELVSYGVNEETGETEVEGFRYDRLTVLLTKTLQEAITRIETLEAKVAVLEG